MDLKINNRVAIVTGSSKGIGKAIAIGLAKEGANVVICSRNKKSLFLAAKEIEISTGAKILPVLTNLEKKEEIKNLMFKTTESFGKIDILINNTGGPPNGFYRYHRKTLV